jgi:hypothetical protein
LEGVVSEPQVWQNKSRFVLYYNTIAVNTPNWILTGRLVTNPISGEARVFPLGVPPNYTPLNPQFNAYYVEIDFSSNPNGIVTFSRDSSIPGYGEIEPTLAEHGFSSGSVSSPSEFYFKIPDQILYRPFQSGGLGFPINGGGVRATSLFLAHAAPYGSIPFEQTSSSEALQTTINGVAVPTNTFGGTPTLGYDPDGVHYYYVVYRGIQDQVISNGVAT